MYILGLGEKNMGENKKKKKTTKNSDLFVELFFSEYFIFQPEVVSD